MKDDLKKKLKEAERAAAKKDGEDKSGQDELEKLKKDLEEMTEHAKRTMADLQNLKRRQEDERRVIFTMANMDLIRSMLPVLDNLDRAKEHVPEGIADWFKGIEMSTGQLHQILDNAGLKPMETTGQLFNPDHHEALVECPGEKNIVIEELEKGYILGDRVLRHAKVKVGNGEPPSK